MSLRRYHHVYGVIALVFALCLLFPTTTLAAGTPTPAPTAKASPYTAAAESNAAASHRDPVCRPLLLPLGQQRPPRARQLLAASPASAASASPTPSDTSASPAPSDTSTPPVLSDTPSANPAPTDTTSAGHRRMGRQYVPDARVVARRSFTIWHGVVREGGAYRRAAPSSAGIFSRTSTPAHPSASTAGWAAACSTRTSSPGVSRSRRRRRLHLRRLARRRALPPEVPPAPDNMQDFGGTWVDANLTLNVATAYEDGGQSK